MMSPVTAPDDDYDMEADPCCAVCGAGLDWFDCDLCGGEGFSHHDCGDDCCCCLEPGNNVCCSQCSGVGGWWWCPNARAHETEAA